MLIFISGGVRSGKSALGEKIACKLAEGNRKIYLATSCFYDEEMTTRIQLHQSQRDSKGFITVEKQKHIAEEVDLYQHDDTVLLDCLGTLVANEQFDEEASTSGIGSIYEKILQDILCINHTVKNLIVISNEVFSDGITYESLVEDYIKTLGSLHITLVQHSDIAIEGVYSSFQCHKKPTGYALETVANGNNKI